MRRRTFSNDGTANRKQRQKFNLSVYYHYGVRNRLQSR
jgi:hypothetical protein